MAGTVGFLGPLGTYSEEAALIYNPTADRPYPTITAVGEAVAKGEVDEGVVPIENSLAGSVIFTLDMLINQPNLFIRGEIDLPIEHYFLTRPDTNPADIKVIYSHPQALSQCQQYMEKNYPQAEQMASLSTVLCVEDMLGSDIPAAAISPRRASELYEVKVVDKGIQDVATNVTRFAVLGHSDHPPTGRDKTSMAFTFEVDTPGLLYRVLGEFARRDINLFKVESRPTKNMLGEYIFMVDCAGHRDESPMKEALEALSDPISMLRVLGSYPRWDPNR
ncbi:MAG: prephenate dehydratase [SAR202 cluster bacterium]|nr:prephenate dehydratase [Chloroflexota bacterium]MQF96034.1 prephenate dehydratase [SAR202 cluster bacterium]MQG33500.1 prephenate dehydratase [SAR202 cluster bacterium]HAA95811.1 prephenate dehydratase [Dehalococcoidia bacterium]HCP23059.1 prephenate dehydratase [Dehalococcoidia bacterium]